MKQSLMKRTLPLFCTAVMALSTGCSSAKPAAAAVAENPAISVHTQTPEYASLEQYATFAGRISPDETVAVQGKVGGTVQQANFEVGDTVRKGQVLYVIDPVDINLNVEKAKVAYDLALKNIEINESGSGSALTELNYQSAITNAQNAYESARDSLELADDDDFNIHEYKTLRKKYKDLQKQSDADPNNKKLAEDAYSAYLKYVESVDYYNDNYKKLLSGFETAYDNYETALEKYEIYKSTMLDENTGSYELQRRQAEASYKSALQQLEYTQIIAPIDGVIEQKHVTVNEDFDTSSVAYVISNKDIINVTFSVSADIARAMSIGDAVKVESGSTVYNAEIVEIGNAVSSSSGLFTVKARVADGSDLFTGVSVKLIAITAKSENALVIPIESIYYESGKAYVYIAKDGVAVKTPVILGVSSTDRTEVLKGLSPEDEIITTWNPNLNDGIAVSATNKNDVQSSATSNADDATSPNQDGSVSQEG